MTAQHHKHTEDELKQIISDANFIRLSDIEIRYNNSFTCVIDCIHLYKNILEWEIKSMDMSDFELEKKIMELVELEPNFMTLPEDSLWSNTKDQYKIWKCTTLTFNIPLEKKCYQRKITYLKAQEARLKV